MPDPQQLNAIEHPIEDLPDTVLEFLLSSRYCEVDLLSVVAAELFGHLPHGWSRVRAVCDWGLVPRPLRLPVCPAHPHRA